MFLLPRVPDRPVAAEAVVGGQVQPVGREEDGKVVVDRVDGERVVMAASPGCMTKKYKRKNMSIWSVV